MLGSQLQRGSSFVASGAASVCGAVVQKRSQHVVTFGIEADFSFHVEEAEVTLHAAWQHSPVAKQ